MENQTHIYKLFIIMSRIINTMRFNTFLTKRRILLLLTLVVVFLLCVCVCVCVCVFACADPESFVRGGPALTFI